MDSESVDRCIQKVLSSLYPPFQATSATVLCQVLSVVDSCYRGDGVHYLLDFLLPAKYLLEALQQHTNVSQAKVQSCDEGWPLCIQEKLVIHLCPVDQNLLLPGDFYLLVSPPLRGHSTSCRSSVSLSPCLFLCSMSEDSGYVEQQEVSEVGLPSLFSMAWLDSVNRQRERRGASMLERCVLTANGDVFRVPWEDVVYPQLLSWSQSHTSTKGQKGSHDQHRHINSWSQEDVYSLPSQKSNQSVAEAEDSEGEYVELREPTEQTCFSTQRDSLTQISWQLRAPSSTHTSTHTNIDRHGHTPHNTHTHPSRVCDVMEELITQDSCGVAILTTFSSTSAPPGFMGTPSQEQTPGTEVVTLREEEEEKRKEEKLMEGEDSVSGDEAVEREEEEEGNQCAEEDEEEGQIFVMQLSQDSHSEDSYCENTTQSHSEDSYCENTTQPHSEDSYCENTTQPHSEDSYCENTTQPHSEDSYCENTTQPHSEDSYCENTTQPHSEHSYCENTTQPHSEHSYCENTTQPHSEDSYCENTTQPHSEDSYCENTTQPHSEDSYCENTTQPHSEDSYCENTTQPHSEDSYCENTTQPHSEDSYCENTTQPHSEDSYCENTTQPHSEHSYCENTTQPHSEHSYCENTTQPHSEDSYCENTTQPHSEDSYCEHTTQPHSEHSYCENTTQPHSEDSYCENTTQPHSEDSYCENTTQPHPEDSCCENTTQPHPEDSYCENTKQPHSEDSYCEKLVPALLQFEEPIRAVTTSSSHLWNEVCEEEERSCEEEEEHKKHNCEEEEEEQKEHSCEEEKQKEHSCEEEKQKEHSCEEEKQKEHSCEEEELELVGGRAANLQNEGLTTVPPGDQTDLRLYNSPMERGLSPQLDQLVAAPVSKALSHSQSPLSPQSSFYSVLLSSGALCLPGTTDRSGRALLMVYTCSSVWSNSECEGVELLRLLLYYSSTLREEVRVLGLTVLVDARKAAPVPVLFSTLRSLQDQAPGSVHTVLLLVDRDTLCVRVDKPTISQVQVEVLTSLKSLHKQVALQQLPVELGGSFSFSQSSWLCFRLRVEQLTSQCDDVINLLQKTISILETTLLPASAQEAELLLSHYKAVMRGVLEDGRLVWLQQEGGASLSLLRREVREAWRAAVESASSMYNQVDELLHHLVTLSNTRTQQLSFILDFRSLEDGFTEVSSWLQEEAEPHLKSLSETEDSLQLVIDKLHQFKEFRTTAYEYCKRGKVLLTRLERWEGVSSADLHVYEVKVHSFWDKLQDFSQRVDDTGQNIERAVQLYSFLDQAYGWALAGLRHLAGISMDECSLPDRCQAVIASLQDYQSRHPPIPDTSFQEMRAAAEELRGERGVRQWNFAWSKCQETKKMFDRKMEAALRTRDSAQRKCSDPTPSTSSTSSRKKISSGLWSTRDSSSSSFPMEDTNNSPLLLSFTSSPLSSSPAPQHTPLLPRLDSTPSFFSSRRQQLRKTQSFDDPPPTPKPWYDPPPTPKPWYGPCSRAISEPVRRGNTGVFIRGLEVSSTEAADRTLCPRTATRSWAGSGVRGPGTPIADPGPKGSKLHHMVEEMMTTEREYVRSLRYIIHHYFPEMERVDVPQDLRGKRSVIFGNLEKLLDFHSQFFLRELESCWRHPLRVSHCFLRHQQQFALYALYSKNKPKSDALLLNYGNFFRRKQLQLGDKMDLSSYLLKPIQRMSKYALLLTDIIKEVGVTQEVELNALQAATSMVKFQLRHGNDLLAMDAIRDCDVNLKEQGQLVRQDEFTIWSGRRKCQRHVFLFEELILFSKHKKMDGGLDIFIYKHSFKTPDVGLTESCGDNGLRFEIWFRRRTSKNQTFILQATSPDTKHAWTRDITHILWTQATRNKEMRLKEMVSMGVGSKPFLDIQPSDAAISDRAVDYIMKSRGARTRASIAVSVLDVNPFKRGLVTSDARSSDPSSSSLLGSLNLHMFSQSLTSAADSSFISSSVEEDEQELETSSQPSMTTESSGSSSRCLSGSTGSDSGCVSSHLQEVLSEEPHQLPSTSSPFNRNHPFISSKPVISPATVM